VKRIFGDTLYWGAVLHERDQYRAGAIRARATLGDVTLVTTGEVLAELLDGLAHRGPYLREAAARAVRKILTNPRVIVHRQSDASFLAGLQLYEQRLDKGYSLVDCVSMTTMRKHEIGEVLTNDHHFTQEGFKTLLLGSGFPLRPPDFRPAAMAALRYE
jgi:predicted nucleic acid-binding protein